MKLGVMYRLIAYVVLILAASVALLFVRGEVMVALLTGFITGCAIPIIDAVFQNWKYLRIVVACVRYYRTHVRISASYLFRIERGGKYLLVRGGRYPNQFQPIGGVYKFHDSARPIFRSWKVETDDLIPVDISSKDDLRIRVEGRHLLRFFKWFESGKNREIGPNRELYEELIEPHLPPEKFLYTANDFLERRVEKIRFSNFANSRELLIADVYELVPTIDQAVELDGLATHASGEGNLIWATADEIRRRGAKPGRTQNYQISSTSRWTI
jgi:hypothetical protein